VRRLVALDLPSGPDFVTALRRCFDDGDAALPLDPRLPAAARRRLLEALAPACVRAPDGETALAGARPIEDGDALVMPTSGTTGAPKGVVLTHAAIVASAEATNERLGVDPDRDGWLCCLPLAHVGGLSVILRALHAGTRLEVSARFTPQAALAAARRGATLVSLVPTMLGRLGADAAAFRTIVLGGSAPPEGLADNVVTTYGLTETGSGVVYDGWPLSGVTVRIADGEVLLRAPMLLRAYRDGTDPRDAAGFLRTGDAGALSASGRLVVHGRLGEMIVTGGENVWPVAVESLLAGVPGVAEVAVAGLPDPEWGERVVAYVVAQQPTAPPSLDALRARVREELGAWAAPKQLVLLDALPRTALGKVRRRELAALGAGGAS
jgi:O-succinylbenzoic acid--CoA ligase